MSAPHPELVIVASEDHARALGFRGPRNQHGQYRWIRAWWPRLTAEALRGTRWSRVTISEGARGHWHDLRDDRMLRELHRGIEEAKFGMIYQPMVFLEL